MEFKYAITIPQADANTNSDNSHIAENQYRVPRAYEFYVQSTELNAKSSNTDNSCCKFHIDDREHSSIRYL